MPLGLVLRNLDRLVDESPVVDQGLVGLGAVLQAVDLGSRLSAWLHRDDLGVRAAGGAPGMKVEKPLADLVVRELDRADGRGGLGHAERRQHRRSQRHRVTWVRMRRLVSIWLPNPRICHPYPLVRLGVVTRGGSPVR